LDFRALDIVCRLQDRLPNVNVTPLGAREAGTSPEIQRKRGWRPSLSHLLIAVAAILAFVFNFLALQDRSETTLVAVATSDLKAGQRISGSDVRFVPVAADFAGVESLVNQTAWNDVEGWVLTRAIAANGVLDSSSLSAPTGAGNLRSMSIPVPVEHAAGGLLAAGDLVDVVSVDDGNAVFVASGLTVVTVAAADSGGIGGFGPYHIVVSVTADQALSLSRAIDSGSIEVVRSTGADRVAGP
jgi:Flp pilus assembly protein CpaB